jgi:hypothetical protein
MGLNHPHEISKVLDRRIGSSPFLRKYAAMPQQAQTSRRFPANVVAPEVLESRIKVFCT